MRKGTVIAWLIIFFSGIAFLFWRNEWVYNLPTPVPENYNTVILGSAINRVPGLKADSKKPLFLHFFNPRCPCSRFNMTHFKSLVKQYGNETDFKIVVLSNKHYTAKEIQNKFDMNVPILFDTAIAAACGVYSTPQAVIISPDQKLYYRGNYNRSRYCADKKTEYARMALESLLSNDNTIVFGQFALKAYGCELPNCTKQ